MRRFEFSGGASKKFWQAARKGAQLELRWGRIGTTGQSKVKVFETPRQAQTELDKLIRQKAGKGYKEVSTKKTSSKKTSSKKTASKKTATKKTATKKTATKKTATKKTATKKTVAAKPSKASKRTMAPETAAKILQSPKYDGENVAHFGKISEALLCVGGALPAKKLDTIVSKLAKTYGFGDIAERVLRKPVDDAMRDRLLRMAKRRVAEWEENELSLGFLVACSKAGCLQEGASLLCGFHYAIHHPALRKRLAKAPPFDPKLARPARDVLERALAKKPEEWWSYGSMQVCLLLAIVLRSGSARSVAFVRKARDAFAAKLDDDPIGDPVETIDLLAKALGVSLTKATAKTRKGSPVPHLAANRGWSVAGKEWTASIWLAKGKPTEWFGMFQESTQLHLTLDSHSKPHWEVDIYNKRGTKRYTNSAGDVSEDHFGLAELKRLEDFPAWLVGVSKKLRTKFDVSKGAFNCGRNRKLRGELRAWLQEGGA